MTLSAQILNRYQAPVNNFYFELCFAQTAIVANDNNPLYSDFKYQLWKLEEKNNTCRQFFLHIIANVRDVIKNI